MKSRFVFYFQWFIFPLIAQNTMEIRGKIFDALSKKPIYQILIINKTSNQTSLSDSSGTFKILAKFNDVICTQSIAYLPDSFKITREAVLNKKPFIFLLSTKVFQLPEVTIQKTVFKPYYNRPWQHPNNERPDKNPLSINYYYQRFSHKFKVLKKVYALNDLDKTQFVLKERFNSKVMQYLGLEDEELEAFVSQLSVSKDFVYNASEYEFMVKMKQEYLNYRSAE